MAKQTVSKATLLAMVRRLEDAQGKLIQRLNAIENATHEHSISPETVLHLADIIKNDFVSSATEQQKAEIIEEVTT